MRRQFTYDPATYPDKVIQRDASDPFNRRYFAFTVPGFVPTQTETPDYWFIELSTFPHGLRSAKRGPYGEVPSANLDTSNNILTGTTSERFTSTVSVGDALELCDPDGNCSTGTISAVNGIRSVTYTNSDGQFGAGETVSYFVYNRQTPQGECPIDEWFGDGAPYTGSLSNVNGGKGGGCKDIRFWSGWGPTPSGVSAGSSIRVHLPPIGWSANDLVKPGYTVGSDGSTGYIPDFWDGMSVYPYFGETWAPPRLEWLVSFINVNTDDVTKAGIGGPLDWNNQNFWQVELATNMDGQDAWILYINLDQ